MVTPDGLERQAADLLHQAHGYAEIGNHATAAALRIAANSLRRAAETLRAAINLEHAQPIRFIGGPR